MMCDANWCAVCKVEQFKYRCPKCQLKSCSLACSKKHLESGLCVEACRSATPNDSMKCVPVVEFEPENVVPAELLARLRESAELKDVLRNPDLRRFLTVLSASGNPWRDLKEAMQCPVFISFADICLKIIDPPEKDENLL
ncbi:unnamed protein product [Notodromas monacha]|uniref:HIT-type domain-containing protein n=1 Tax=Notodromas monacha TaxID=399045 RepID=A0A7R9GA10_9CRUS|nr:unnamed protein product [Notodromas monacha]CAG0914857.1 unnamed protein product [Notodromas monacha]